MKSVIELIILVVLLVLAAFTAASEIAIIAVSRLRLRKLSSEGSKTAKIILKILEMPERFFSTILVANDIIDALIAVLVTAMVIRFFKGEGRLEVIVSTAIASFLIILSEVTAKTIAARYPERSSDLLARPVRGLIAIFTPLVKGLEVVIHAVINLIGDKEKRKTSLVSEEEIRALIKIGEEDGTIQKEKYKMLSKVFDFGETIVRNVMTPKEKIVSIDMNAAIEDIMDDALESGYSRFPVHKDTKENIVGSINMKDLISLSVNKGLILLQDIIYPSVTVPGTKKITELLKEFQKGHTHLAMVADPKGKVEGLVTLEDLLEEIVGEIEDEYDVRTKAPQRPQ